MKPHPTHTRTDRAEGVVLVVILLLVAGFAGAASFTHVKDWTLDNSPPAPASGSAGPTPSSPNWCPSRRC